MKKEAVYRFLLAVIAVTLIAVSCFAWFYINKRAAGSGHALDTADVAGLDQILYHQFYDKEGVLAGEEAMARLVIQNDIPGQREYYRLELKNTTSSDMVASVTFQNITDVLPDGAESRLSGDMNLCRVVHLCGVSTDAQTGSPVFDSRTQTAEGCSFYDLYDQPDSANFSLGSNITVPAGKTVNLFFQNRLVETAGNIYQNKAVYVEKIAIASKAVSSSEEAAGS